jgi:sugar/nucleoside kinase (ribokinase family)
MLSVDVNDRATVIRDRLGAGDAFVAGLLDGLLDGDLAAGMERAAALAGIALATAGDQVEVSRADLNAAIRARSRGVDR